MKLMKFGLVLLTASLSIASGGIENPRLLLTRRVEEFRSTLNGLRCQGRNDCCSRQNPCQLYDGNCETDNQCQGDLICVRKRYRTDACIAFYDRRWPYGHSYWTDKVSCCTLRCSGEDSSCCTEERPCDFGEGDCDHDGQCKGNLVCGSDNCPQSGFNWDNGDDCCTYSDRSKKTKVYKNYNALRFQKLLNLYF